MSIGSRMKERRELLGMTQIQFANALGVTKGAIGNYETGANSPKASLMYKVFDILKCDANYLFQDEMKEFETDDFTVPEIKMVKKYRILDDYGKEAVDSILNIEYERISCKKEDEELEESSVQYFPFLYYRQASSAGFGDWADSEYAEEVQLVKRPPLGASFIIPVNGDSMEPTYPDGCKVFVRSQNEIREGQVGIFYMDGKSWIKELGNDELISHNPEYPPQPFREDLRCWGLVMGICDDSYFR